MAYIFFDMLIYTSRYEVFIILFLRDLKNKNVLHIPSTTHNRQNKKVFGVKSEILMKYKRIKCTPSRKASHLLPGG